jgi:Na+/melibiose symporter-like transporter
MAFMTTTWQFYVLRFFLGAAEAASIPLSIHLHPALVHCLGPGAGDRSFDLAQISGIIGAPLAGWMLRALGLKGWQGLFILEAIPAVVFAFIIISWMADRPGEARWLTEEEKKFLTEQYERELATKTEARRYTVLQAFKDPEVLKLCVTYFLWISGFWGFNYWMPQVLKSLSGWSNLAIGWLTAAPMGVSLLVMIFIGHSSSKRREKRWHGAIGLFIGAVGMGVGVFMGTLDSVLFVILSAVGVCSFGVWWSCPTTFLSGHRRQPARSPIIPAATLADSSGRTSPGLLKSHRLVLGAWVYLACSLTLAGMLILTFKKQMPADGVLKQ